MAGYITLCLGEVPGFLHEEMMQWDHIHPPYLRYSFTALSLTVLTQSFTLIHRG